MSVFSSSLRAFFSTLFGFLGLVVGILVIALLFGLMSSGKKETDSPTKVTVIPDHTGEKRSLSSNSPLILVIGIEGVIGISDLNTETIRTQIERSYAFPKGRIRGVLLTINSPGGGVTDSFAIYQLIKAYKEQLDIPVYAFTDGYCASGGYLIGCAANQLFASPVSVIGSVGARATLWNVSDTLEKLGVKTKMLTQGKDKGELDPFVPWKEGDDEGAKAIMAALYEQFIDLVVENRPNLSADKLVNDYGAQVFIAKSAEEKGYIDGILPTRNEALLALVQSLELVDSGYQVIELTGKQWFEDLFKLESPLITGKLKHTFELPPALYN